MVTPREAITAYRSTRRLIWLYDAYRASARAHALVVERMRQHLQRSASPDPKQLAMLADLERQAALAAETDLAFHQRGEDLRRRLVEIAAMEVGT